MKIISWNIRGLGGFEKRKEVCPLVREKCSYILCIQETKLSIISEAVCKSIWKDAYVDFSYPSNGASGGLVTFWDCKEVEVWSSFYFEHVIQIQGRFVKSDVEFTLLNVYAPCD